MYQALVELPGAESGRAPVGPVWNVPARSAQFTGRATLLAQLRRSLLAGGTTVAHACALIEDRRDGNFDDRVSLLEAEIEERKTAADLPVEARRAAG